MQKFIQPLLILLILSISTLTAGSVFDNVTEKEYTILNNTSEVVDVIIGRLLNKDGAVIVSIHELQPGESYTQFLPGILMDEMTGQYGPVTESILCGHDQCISFDIAYAWENIRCPYFQNMSRAVLSKSYGIYTCSVS